MAELGDSAQRTLSTNGQILLWSSALSWSGNDLKNNPGTLEAAYTSFTRLGEGKHNTFPPEERERGRDIGTDTNLLRGGGKGGAS